LFILAPAKLNLLLKVFSQREDNYHELFTLYQLVAWGDIVSLTPSSVATSIDISGDYAADVPKGECLKENLLWRAWELMAREASQQKAKFKIGLKKNIPVGSGLGGGSSDAAALLKMLRLIWLPHMPIERLAELCLDLGADVPLFVKGFSSWAGSVGEKLGPDYLSSYYYLLFSPAIQSSTAKLFNNLAANRTNVHNDRSRPTSIELSNKAGEDKTGEDKAGGDKNCWLNDSEPNDFMIPFNTHVSY